MEDEVVKIISPDSNWLSLKLHKWENEKNIVKFFASRKSETCMNENGFVIVSESFVLSS